jgi:hypothetical protein
VLVGSAVVIGGAGVLRHRRRVEAAEAELRAETAAAMEVIGDLGARVLAAEDGGAPTDAAVVEGTPPSGCCTALPRETSS